MKNTGLWDRVYNKDAFTSSYSGGAGDHYWLSDQANWLYKWGWPTLKEMISSGRNIFLVDNKDLFSLWSQWRTWTYCRKFF